MSSVGETLRRERLRKGLALDEISRETKISGRLLDAIEREQFDLLPGGVFAKSFVRQYARYLGLDEDELGAEVDKVVSPATELPSFEAANQQPAFKVPRLMDWPGSGRSNSSILPALAMVVAVMLVCSAVYAWWQRRPATPPPPAAAVRKAPAVEVPKPEPASVTPAESSTPPAEPKTEIAQATLPSESPAGVLHVSMTADSDTWLQAWADGKTVMTGVLQPNSVKTVDGSDKVRIRTGNAGSLQVTVNGKAAGSLGPKGQVRTVEITREGVQILAPPPKPAPAPEPL